MLSNNSLGRTNPRDAWTIEETQFLVCCRFDISGDQLIAVLPPRDLAYNRLDGRIPWSVGQLTPFWLNGWYELFVEFEFNLTIRVYSRLQTASRFETNSLVSHNVAPVPLWFDGLNRIAWRIVPSNARVRASNAIDAYNFGGCNTRQRREGSDRRHCRVGAFAPASRW